VTIADRSPEPTAPTPVARPRRVGLDLSPLRASRDYRLLMGSGVVTMIGSFLTMIAVPVQVKQLTGSAAAVGLVGVAEFVPMLLCSLYGGALADWLDRRRVIIGTELGLLACAGGLAANALSPSPRLWVIYLLAGLTAACDSVQRPSIDGLVPRYVPHSLMPAAAAVTSLRWNVGGIVGPAVGGVIVATAGVATGYLVDVASFCLSLTFLVRLAAAPAGPDAERAGLASIAAGLRYAAGRGDLIGTYAVDVVAMILATPLALYPFLAARSGAAWVLGALYAAESVGAMLATLLSGWTVRVHRHGFGVILAGAAWGGMIACAGLTTVPALVVLCLVAAGAADMISGIFRAVMWNQSIPDELRGRLAGIELLSYSSGPMLGNARAGLVAQWGGARLALSSGGLLCVGGVAAVSAVLPGFRRYDARTSPHVRATRARREAGTGMAAGTEAPGETVAPPPVRA
jgi:MFS family permease